MFKKMINDFFRLVGYQFIQVPYSKRKIKSGHYKWLEEFGINTILDVGANEGQFAKIISKIIPGAHIYSFEPLKHSFMKLEKELSSNKNISLFNFALGNEEKEAIIYRNEFSPSSSILELSELHKNAFPFTKNVSEEKIYIRVMDKVIQDFKLKKKILMKIDVQGYELNVLQGSFELLNDVDIVIVETSFYELYKNQPLFREIYEFLLRKNFYFSGNLEQVYDPLNGRILQADSIFRKVE